MVEKIGGRIPTRAELTRERILEAAEVVFAKHGLNGTRIREIAETAGVNNATIYSYFPSKTELYEAVLERGMRPLIDLMTEFSDRGRSDMEAAAQARACGDEAPERETEPLAPDLPRDHLRRELPRGAFQQVASSPARSRACRTQGGHGIDAMGGEPDPAHRHCFRAALVRSLRTCPVVPRAASARTRRRRSGSHTRRGSWSRCSSRCFPKGKTGRMNAEWVDLGNSSAFGGRSR